MIGSETLNVLNITSNQVWGMENPINRRTITLTSLHPCIHKACIQHHLNLCAAQPGIQIARQHCLWMRIPCLEQCVHLCHSHVRVFRLMMQVCDENSQCFLSSQIKLRPNITSFYQRIQMWQLSLGGRLNWITTEDGVSSDGIGGRAHNSVRHVQSAREQRKQ